MRKTTLMLAVLALFAAQAAEAQETGVVSITIGKVAYINLPDGGDVTFESPTNADFVAGEIAANDGVTIEYGSNAAHDLQIELDQLGGKDVADLQWSVDTGAGFGGYTPMQTLPVNMASNGAGGFNTADVQFKMALDWATDVEGTYSGTITYTVVAN